MENIKEENKKLKQEIIILEKKLSLAKTWMERQIKEEIKKIKKRKINTLSVEEKNFFIKQNLEEIIEKKVKNFFWDFILMNLNPKIISNIVIWEISYYNLKQNPHLDWLSVISSYHKALDLIIESIITKPFRKFAKKNNFIFLRKNDPLEKSLNLVINKWYLLSIGRLYHLLNNIKNNKNLFDFTIAFKKFLEKYKDLEIILLDDNFLKIFKEIIETEILWKKRHSWKITFLETKKARKLIIWDLKDKNCLIYNLVKFWDINY